MRFKKYILYFFLIPIILITPPSIFIEILAREMPNVYRDKNLAIINNERQYKALILGSSHAYYGINPDLFSMPVLNAANVSQDLKYDHFLLSKAIENKVDLQYVILSMSVFTPFNDLDNGIESWRKYNYRHWFDFNPLSITDYFDPSYHSVFFASPSKPGLAKRIIQYAMKGPIESAWSQDGWGLDYNFSSSAENIYSKGKTAAARHQSHTFNKNNIQMNINYLKQIASLCSKNNIKLLIVTTPTYITYRSNLESERLNTMTSIISQISQDNNIKYINFLDDDRFELTDYADADHLNHQGAQKLSKIIDNLITSRVGMWRGSLRPGLSVSAPFVWRCLSSQAVAPFPHPAHRTGRADFPHPALGQDIMPSPTAGYGFGLANGSVPVVYGGTDPGSATTLSPEPYVSRITTGAAVG